MSLTALGPQLRVWLAAPLLALPGVAMSQVIHTYEIVPTAPGAAIPNNSCGGGGGYTADFNVPATDSFTVGGVGTIALGIVIDHNTRDHVQVFLRRPGGTEVQLIDGVATDANDDYNITISDPHDPAAPINDSNLDPIAVAVSGGAATTFYRRLVNFTNFSSTVYPGTGPANGLWRLRVCDDAGGDTGVVVRAQLTLRNNAATSVPVQCGTSSSFNWLTLTTAPASAVNTTMADGTTWTVDGLQWTQFRTVEATGDGPVRPSFRRENLTTGGVLGYFISWMAIDDLPGSNVNEVVAVETTEFRFSSPVLGFDFQLLDVDESPGAWEDYVRIIGFDAAGRRVPYLSTFIAASPSLSRVGDYIEADGVNIDNAFTDGNVRIRFTRAITSVVVTYAQGDEPVDNAAQQRIGINAAQFCAYDYGDAPASYGVTLAAAGPRHVLGDRALFIGSVPDGESDGVPTTAADSDQATNSDESPVQSLPFGVPAYLPQGGQVCNATAGGGGTYTTAAPPGINPNEPGQYCLVVNVTNNSGSSASLVGWIDFNGDGDFLDAGERSNAALGVAGPGSFSGGNLVTGLTSVQRILVWTNVTVPATPAPGTLTPLQSYLRLRLSTDPTFTSGTANPSSQGLVGNGEVEDHVVAANTLPVTLAHVDVRRSDSGSLLVRWTTATEAGARGFRVLQQQSDRRMATLTERLVPSAVMTSTRPSDYEARVSTTTDGPIYLEEVSVGGKVERFGPYQVGTSTGKRPQLAAAPWAQARSERLAYEPVDNAARRARASERGMTPAAEILVSKTGWQRVSVSDLAAAGVDFAGRPVSALRLSHGETVVPFRVAGGGSTLSPTSVLEFWGESVTGSLYTSTRPYLLAVASGGRAWLIEDGTPQAGPAATVWRTERSLDEDRDYSVTAPNGDPWFFDMITRNGTPQAGKQWTLDLPGADTSVAGQVELELWGGVGIPELAQDHRYRLTINGSVVGEDGFDGVMSHERQFPVPAGVLRAGENTVRLDLIDTGDSFDRVFVERISVSHTASLSATSGRVEVPPGAFVGVPERVFAGAFEDAVEAPLACGLGCEQIEVRGFASPDLVAMRMTDAGPVELAGVVATPAASGSYVARVRSAAHGLTGGDGGPSAGALVLVERAKAEVPALRPALALPHPLAGGAAELLVVSSARFAGSVGGLVSARQAEGLTARVVTVDQVYAAYSGGIVDPEAIRRFVGEARQQLGTRYVLLVGGDTYDYFDRLGLGSVSDVPTLYRKTHEYVSFAPVDPAFGDVDGDGRPELAVGRLPARTLSELESLLVKVLAPLPADPHTALFVAERANAAEGIDYASDLEALIAGLGSSWQGGIGRVYLDSFPNSTVGTAAARSEFVSQVNAGRNWVSYFGHASPATWSRETLLDAEDLPGVLDNAGRWPVVSEFGCWGGYFVEPTYTTLAHAWLLTANRGARAMLASTSLTESSSDRAIAEALVPQVSTPGIRLGDALLNAQQAIHGDSPERSDVIMGMTLLGDPSARLTPPN
jgi:subtilisin-like proprotein convertase family protein